MRYKTGSVACYYLCKVMEKIQKHTCLYFSSITVEQITPKLNDLEQTIITSFLGSEIQEQLNWLFLAQVPMRSQLSSQLGLWSHLKAQLGERVCFQPHLWLLAGICLSHELSTGLPHSLEAEFPQESERQHSRQKPQSFSTAQFNHFYHLLLIRRNSVRPAHPEGQGSIQGCGLLASLGLSQRTPTPGLIQAKNIFRRTHWKHLTLAASKEGN